MINRVKGAPERLRYREKPQFWILAQPIIGALCNSKLPNFVRSLWYEVDEVRDLSDNTVCLPTILGDKSSTEFNEKFDRFKRSGAIIAASQLALTEILDIYKDSAPAVVAQRGSRTLAGVLPHGLGDLHLNKANMAYEIGLRSGYWGYRGAICAFRGEKRQAIIPEYPGVWIANDSINLRQIRGDIRIT